MNTIPAELRDCPQWVVWRSERRNGKPTKVPYQATNPRARASATDPATWASYGEALLGVEQEGVEGPGFVLEGFSGIDLDRCYDPKHERLESPADSIIAAIDSYAEISPSGQGVKTIFRGERPGERRRKGKVEWYDAGRFFTITGRHLRGTPLEVRAVEPQRLRQVYEHAFGPDPQPATPTPISSALEDGQLLERAFRAANGRRLAGLWEGDTNGYGSASEADLALCGMLAFWAGPDPSRIDRLFRRSGLMRPKWDERRGSTSYGAQTIALALAGRHEFYQPPGQGLVVQHGGPVPTFMPAANFVRLDFPDPEWYLGSETHPVLYRGCLAMIWGRRGSAKTTLLIDLVAHTAAGVPWLDLPSARPLRWLLIENESSPGLFQNLLEEKLKHWEQDSSWFDNVFVHGGVGDKLWGHFSFRHEIHRRALHDFCRENAIDMVGVNPTLGVGAGGSGSPEQTQSFVDDYLKPIGLWLDIGYLLLHHTNKQREVSGDWDRQPDTEIQLQRDGKLARTKLTWHKVRPSREIAQRPDVQLLDWVTEHQGFALSDVQPTAGVDDEEIYRRIDSLLRKHPGALTGEIKKAVTGQDERIVQLLDIGVEQGRYRMEQGTRRGRHYWLADLDDQLGLDAE